MIMIPLLKKSNNLETENLQETKEDQEERKVLPAMKEAQIVKEKKVSEVLRDQRMLQKATVVALKDPPESEIKRIKRETANLILNLIHHLFLRGKEEEARNPKTMKRTKFAMLRNLQEEGIKHLNLNPNLHLISEAETKGPSKRLKCLRTKENLLLEDLKEIRITVIAAIKAKIPPIEIHEENDLNWSDKLIKNYIHVNNIMIKRIFIFYEKIITLSF